MHGITSSSKTVTADYGRSDVETARQNIGILYVSVVDECRCRQWTHRESMWHVVYVGCHLCNARAASVRCAHAICCVVVAVEVLSDAAIDLSRDFTPRKQLSSAKHVLFSCCLQFRPLLGPAVFVWPLNSRDGTVYKHGPRDNLCGFP